MQFSRFLVKPEIFHLVCLKTLDSWIKVTGKIVTAENVQSISFMSYNFGRHDCLANIHASLCGAHALESGGQMKNGKS